NPYLQYFCGLKGFSIQAPFAPSLLVEIRKRMGVDVFEQLHQAIINQLERRTQPVDPTTDGDNASSDLTEPTSVTETSTETAVDSTESDIISDQKQEPITHQGRLLLDATVAEQGIRFPTDLSLLNESREISERLIDELYALSSLTKKPRTYRKIARSAYLAIVKQRRPGPKKIRKGVKEQLQYLQRNLATVESLLNERSNPAIPLSPKKLKQYWVIQHIYSQQAEMYRTKSHRCDDRIVSIHQPHVRSIIRGKLNKSVEFGAKMSVSLTAQGLARVDHIRWDAFNEGGDLETQVEAYLRRYGFYPEAVVADPVYGTQKNRAYLKDKGIRYAGKALGRPKKVTEQNREQLKRDKQQRQADYRQRIPIEGKFGQGKRAYGLNQIQAKTARTSEAWINSIFFVMNLLVLLRHFFVPAIVQRCINKYIEFLLQKTKRIFITPVR
ncbi:MAG: IS5/IS1182 family transposase, partial [Planctomycetia bacterium]|nr:IS5/IS1182 family transposase [Planctomycetia bacterium]